MGASIVAALVLILNVAVLASAASTDEDGLCRASCFEQNGTCVFDFKVNPFASETGYFTVDGCEGVQPTLLVNANTMYCFRQYDISNWMHPLGFGYLPDGALKENPELEPEVNPYDESCVETSSCQRPLYFLNGQFLGSEEDVLDFGLDVYEPAFMLPRMMWAERGNFEVCLNVTQTAVEDIFIFCHIHDFMSLRVKIADDNVLRQPDADLPPLGYNYAELDSFDQTCGTFRVAPFQDTCGTRTFLCNLNGSVFGECMNALDCAMHEEMQVDISADERVTFVDQMIPHHLNAVNMAKSLLNLAAPGQLDEEFVDLLWNIINTQNMQVTYMRAFLASQGLEDRGRICEANHCGHGMESQTSSTPTSTAAPTSSPTPIPEPEATCFPADAVVELEDGRLVRMDELQIGARVRVSANEFSEVVFWGHKSPQAVPAERFVRLQLEGGIAITVSTGHLVPTQQGLRRAGVVRHGDLLAHVSHGWLRVETVEQPSGFVKGLYNPHTRHGSIVVNQVVFSCYTDVLLPGLAHALLLVERVAFRLGWSLLGMLLERERPAAFTAILAQASALKLA
ncbi:Protein hedgehog [Porphyridium purpureum]|uniref:Protein hedgehog n=1 Tax=Porphyridium purpureum TaxID=35688 RepID=A0A5J4YTS2_PORPP|nr:Protein hedgehog [Porphyridium purpureum]|eukprot:POR1173..scf227_4